MRHRLTDKELVDIVRGYSVELVPAIELGKRYGVTRQSIMKALKRAGVDTRKEVASWIASSCIVCGKETKMLRCKFRKARHVFCGADCYYAWLKHGNGNPLIMHRHSSRIAREIISDHIRLTEAMIVHHEDRNQYNNSLNNLRVFANQGDHVRYHRVFEVPIVWDGRYPDSVHQ